MKIRLWIYQSKWKYFLISLLLFILGLLVINYPITDESDWIAAGKLYLNAINNHNWANTYVGAIAGHPGITVLWISSLLHQFSFLVPTIPLDYLHRLAFILIRVILIVLTIIIVKKWFSVSVLVLTVIYWLVNPYLLLATRITWLDQLLTWLFILIISLWLKYLKEKSIRYLVLSSILLGLALLTKVAALFLVVVMLLLSVKNIANNPRFIYKIISVFLLAAFVFFVFYPAMWVDPIHTPFNRFNRSSLIEAKLGGSGSQNVLFYPSKIPFVDPLLLLGIVILFLKFPWKNFNKDLLKNQPQLLAISGIIYILLIIITSLTFRDYGNSANAFYTGYIRYLVPAIPPLSLYVIDTLYSSLNKKIFFIFFFILIIYSIIRLPFSPIQSFFYTDTLCNCVR